MKIRAIVGWYGKEAETTVMDILKELGLDEADLHLRIPSDEYNDLDDLSSEMRKEIFVDLYEEFFSEIKEILSPESFEVFRNFMRSIVSLVYSP